MILKPRIFRRPRKGHWATKGLVGYWLLNEGSGNKVFDLSGNGNTGLLFHDSHYVPGKFGSCIEFDGDEDYFNVPHSPILTMGLSDFTLSIWTKIPVTLIDPQYGPIISKVNASLLGGYLLSYNKEAARTLFARVSGGTNVVSDNALNDNIWHHIVIMRSGANGSMYVDGIKQASTQADWNQDVTGTDSLKIGAWPYQVVTSYHEGQVDLPLIYKRALSASEIALLYREPFCMFERDLIELWVGSVGAGEPPTGIPILRRRRECA